MRLYTVLLSFIAFATTAGLHAQNSPYINKVYEYCPAPGQFVNDYPRFSQGDTADSMLAKASEYVVGNARSALSLGGFGGYIVFGFDHKIQNIKGKMDFQVLGNAFASERRTVRPGGSSEPGIIMVSEDTNGNGIPDDTWYEIAGSEYFKKTTKKNYTITYFRSNDNIRWTDSDGKSGTIDRNQWHTQDSYYPMWIAKDTMSFTGTRLADNYANEGTKAKPYYVQYFYDYGYADNLPNDSAMSKIDIGWAVDADGNAVNLSGIDFVKVYTGVNQKCGDLGETSTEVAGAIDLHLAGGDIDSPVTTGITPLQNSQRAMLNPDCKIYNINGQRIVNPVNGSIYIIKNNVKTEKIVWKQ